MRYGIDYSKSKSGSITLKFTIDPKEEKYVITFNKDNSIARISRKNKIVTNDYTKIVVDTAISLNDNKYDIILCIDREGNKSYLIFDNGKLRQYITDKLNIQYSPDTNVMTTTTKVVSVLNSSLAFFCERYDGSVPNLICINGKLYSSR